MGDQLLLSKQPGIIYESVSRDDTNLDSNMCDAVV